MAASFRQCFADAGGGGLFVPEPARGSWLAADSPHHPFPGVQTERERQAARRGLEVWRVKLMRTGLPASGGCAPS